MHCSSRSTAVRTMSSSWRLAAVALAMAGCGAAEAPTPGLSATGQDATATKDSGAQSDVGAAADGGGAAAKDAAPDPDVSAGSDAPSTPDTSFASGCKVTPHLSSIEQQVFVPKCATSACHGAAKPSGSLDLHKGKAYTELVGVIAASTGAAGWTRVVPGDPDQSFLVVKLTGPLAGQGKLMPVGASAAVDPDCTIAAIRAWIQAGAPND